MTKWKSGHSGPKWSQWSKVVTVVQEMDHMPIATNPWHQEWFQFKQHQIFGAIRKKKHILSTVTTNICRTWNKGTKLCSSRGTTQGRVPIVWQPSNQRRCVMHWAHQVPIGPIKYPSSAHWNFKRMKWGQWGAKKAWIMNIVLDSAERQCGHTYEKLIENRYSWHCFQLPPMAVTWLQRRLKLIL